MLKATLIAVCLLFVVSTALPFIRTSSAWIRMFDFPRTHIAIGGLCVTLLYCLFVWDIKNVAENVMLAILMLCVLFQGYKISAYTFLASQQVLSSNRHSSDSTFSLLVSNVLMENRNAGKYLEIVREADPDILLAVETDQWWTEQLGALDQKYRYTVEYPLANCYGMLLRSRLKLIDPQIKFLIEDDVPSIHTGVELESSDRIVLHCLHPKPPQPAHSRDSTERDAELLVVARAVTESDQPTLVAGDLNDVAWSRTTKLFQKISGLLDPRIGRGMYNTFSAKNPLFRWPLDHVFHSNDFKLIKLERLSSFGSDHFPVYIKLSYEPEAKAQQQEPAAGMEEREEATEKIGKGQKDAVYDR
ncbi:MAG: endonuclease/exonuclease/phosphatase family protein [Candidatus Binatia bacterium]